jgi:WD40 repeat protein
MLMNRVIISCALSLGAAAYAGDCDPIQSSELLASDGAAEDWFGQAVVIRDDIIVVGVPEDDDNGFRSGSAYVFVFDGSSWVEQHKVTASDGESFDQFGFSVDISGTIAVIGAPPFFEADTDGSAYLLDLVTGEELAILLPDDGPVAEHFGHAVAINGTRAVVGSPRDDDNGFDAGAAYLFDTATGEQIVKLVAEDTSVLFGISVAMSGSTIVIGASGSGAAYVFDTNTGRQITKLVPDDGESGDAFGISVNISGAIAIVGAHHDDDFGSNSGSGYLFDVTTGEQLAKLLPDDGAEGDQFGLSVAVSGSVAIVGSYLDWEFGDCCHGSAYLFDVTTGEQIAKILPDDNSTGDMFGWAVSISGGRAIGGAVRHDDNGLDSGAAYIFDLPCVSACPADVSGDGEVNVTDLTLVILAWGQTGGAADVNGDGIVAVLDLVEVITNWGPC